MEIKRSLINKDVRTKNKKVEAMSPLSRSIIYIYIYGQWLKKFEPFFFLKRPS